MARPRTLSDDEILERIADSLEGATGPWSLESAAAATGLHAATLIKRFGSRHGLLLALSRRWIAGIPEGATGDDAMGELRRWAASLADPGAGVPAAEETTNSDDNGGTAVAVATRTLARIDMLVEDLRDPELRLLLHEGWSKHLAHLTALVGRAQDDGRLRAALPAPQLARLLLDAAHGGILRDAVAPDSTGTASADSVLTALEALS